MLTPVRGSSRSTVTLVLAADPSLLWAEPLSRSIQTRTWYRRGFGHSIPTKRRIAPARPLPATPLFSAMEASPFDAEPPGRIAGARTSTAGSRNLSSATSLSWRCPSVVPAPGPAGARLFCVPGSSPPRADVSTAGGCQRIAHTSSSRYANTRMTIMTSHPIRPGAGIWRPGSKGRKNAALSSSTPRVNAFTRSLGAWVGCVTPYRVMSTAAAAAKAAVTNRSVRTAKW